MFNHTKSKRNIKRLVLYSAAALLVTTLLTATAVTLWYRNNTSAVDSANQTSTPFVISTGESAILVSDRLELDGLIKSSTAFNLYLRLNSKTNALQAGDYTLMPSMDVQQIVTELSNGFVESRNVTILSGKRLDQVKRKLIEDGFTEASVDIALDAKTHLDHPIAKYKPVDASLEGYVYPETFQITENTTATELIRKSLDEMFKRITPDLISGLEAQGLNVHDAIILSSIVEKEVGNVADKPLVAQVFLKRLREGIELGSDVTYIYASRVFGGRAAPDLDNPYNTRIYSGLPPGPVSNFEITSIEALANPSDTEFLFFVSGDDGTTHYTKTFAEHNAAIAKYCDKNCLLPDQRDDIID